MKICPPLFGRCEVWQRSNEVGSMRENSAAASNFMWHWGHPWQWLHASVNLLQLLPNCWQNLGPVKFIALLCLQISRKASWISLYYLWKVAETLWSSFPSQGQSVQMSQGILVCLEGVKTSNLKNRWQCENSENSCNVIQSIDVEMVSVELNLNPFIIHGV